MRTFALYHHPERGFEVVKQGFCWPAAFYGPLWALGRGFTWIGLGLALAYLLAVAVAVICLLTASLGLFLLWLLLMVLRCLAAFVGAAGNLWIVKKLQNRGYLYVSRRQARSPADIPADELLRKHGVRKTT